MILRAGEAVVDMVRRVGLMKVLERVWRRGVKKARVMAVSAIRVARVLVLRKEEVVPVAVAVALKDVNGCSLVV